MPLFTAFTFARVTDGDQSGGVSLWEMAEMCRAIGREMKVSKP